MQKGLLSSPFLLAQIGFTCYIENNETRRVRYEDYDL